MRFLELIRCGVVDYSSLSKLDSSPSAISVASRRHLDLLLILVDSLCMVDRVILAALRRYMAERATQSLSSSQLSPITTTTSSFVL